MHAKIKASFWSDADIEKQPPEIKLALLWIMTNAQLNICGFCQVSERRFTFETGLAQEWLQKTFEALPRALKHFKEESITYIPNFIRYQLGDGEQLEKNNVFKSVLSIYKGIRFQPLKDAIAADYPVIARNADTYLERNMRDHVVAPGLRSEILERDGFQCFITGEILPEFELEVDHVIPRCLGGRTEPENLAAISKNMNCLKNGKTLSEFCKLHSFDLQAIQNELARRASKPFPARGKGKEKEKEKEKDGEKENSLGKGCGENLVEPPPGFPATETEAIAACMTIGCPSDFITHTWNKALSRGGVDASGNPIRNFARYVKTEMKYETDRKGREKNHANNQPGGKPNPHNFGIPPSNNLDRAKARIARDNAT